MDPAPVAGGLSIYSAEVEVDVEAEEQEVLSMTAVLGSSRQDIEKALMEANGDWEYVMEVPTPC